MITQKAVSFLNSNIIYTCILQQSAGSLPFVEEGCYLEIEGDDLEIWRWKFRNGKVVVQYPTFLWDDDEEESCETAT